MWSKTEEAAYKTRMFRAAGVQPLTPEQRKDLTARLALHDKDECDLPSLPDCQEVHYKEVNGCGMRSAIFYGRTPQGGSAGGDLVYYCLYCDTEFLGG